jgi:hypothetical protein
VHGGVGVAAEDSLRPMVASMGQRAVGYLRGQSQPASVEPIKEASQSFVFRIPLLELEIKQCPNQIIHADIVHYESVELMSMDCDVTQAAIFPLIFLIDTDAYQVRHDVCEAAIMVSFDPHHFDVAFGIGEFANKAEEFPMFFFETSEVEVGENIAEQNKAAISCLFQNAQRLASAAHVRAEVQIGKDQRVVKLRRHVFNCRRRVLRGNELAINRGRR